MIFTIMRVARCAEPRLRANELASRANQLAFAFGAELLRCYAAFAPAVSATAAAAAAAALLLSWPNRGCPGTIVTTTTAPMPPLSPTVTCSPPPPSLEFLHLANHQHHHHRPNDCQHVQLLVFRRHSCCCQCHSSEADRNSANASYACAEDEVCGQELSLGFGYRSWLLRFRGSSILGCRGGSRDGGLPGVLIKAFQNFGPSCIWVVDAKFIQYHALT